MSKIANLKNLSCLFLIFFSATIFASEKIESNIRNTFSKYKHSSSINRYNVEFFKTFIGDTILFSFTNQYLEGFFIEQPDTIWIKKQPKKNPTRGKHYILNYAYKGILIGDKFLTPSSAINEKPFLVYSVKPYANGNGCSITLHDLGNHETITANFPKSFPYDGSFTTAKTQGIINSIKDSDVYYSKNVPSYYPSYSKLNFSKCKVIGGEFNVNISKSMGIYDDYKLESKCEIYLQDENGNFITMSPFKEAKYIEGIPTILTKNEYDRLFRSYSINSDVDLNTLNTEENFPFSFTVIPGYTSINSSLYQSIEPNSPYQSAGAHLNQREVITIGDMLTIGNTNYYKACFNGKAFFINTKEVTLDEKGKSRLDSLIQQPQEIRDRFFRRQVALSKIFYLNKINETIDNIHSYAKYGLAIPEWGVYDMSEYTDGTGIRFSFYNPTKLDIKYITITFQGYNAVDDPVGRPITKKGIGPIKPEESASYDFEYAWYTDIVEYAKIRSIIVQYKNGASRTISNPTFIIFPQNLRDSYYKSNPVENLR